MDNLRLIVLSNFKDVGKMVDEHLQKLYGKDSSFIVPIEEIRFNNGEGKIVINDTIREKDVYILCDVGNYSCTYKMFGFENHKSADDHFQDLKRVIYAIKGQAEHIHIITPLLYESRQHRRKGRESLDCALGLQDLASLNVKDIITFDAHDVGMQNAVPLTSFENFYPTMTILDKFIENETIDLNNMIIVSPDMGAASRARLYADIFSTNVGMFYKRRDLTKVVNGKNPIIEHKYIGEDVKGKNVIVVDDMIASGDSMIDVAKSLKNLGANKVYLTATFSLFTNGIDNFKDAYDNGLFEKVYSTNLSYVNSNYDNEEWFVKVDCSKQIAKIIEHLNKKLPLSELLDDRKKITKSIHENKTHANNIFDIESSYQYKEI